MEITGSRVMETLNILVKHGVFAPEEITKIVKEAVRRRAVDPEWVIGQLCGLSLSDDKIDIFALVCERLRTEKG